MPKPATLGLERLLGYGPRLGDFLTRTRRTLKPTTRTAARWDQGSPLEEPLASPTRRGALAVGRPEADLANRVRLDHRDQVVVCLPRQAGEAARREVTNGGPGVALNVRAVLRWGPPLGIVGETVPASLAPGEARDLVIRWGAEPQEDWQQVLGAIYYNVVAGDLWETEFRIYMSATVTSSMCSAPGRSSSPTAR